MFIKSLLVFIVSMITLMFFSQSYAETTIKLAIIDNFHYQKFVTTHYKEYYLSGVELALIEAKKNGININYKVFQYDDKPLSILSKIPELIEWEPDFIIGPRDSNRFLLLTPYIKNTLTLSPFATSTDIKNMPDNFHSVTLLTDYEAVATYDFINYFFKNKNAFILTESDCKSCMDVSEKIISIWKKDSTKKISQSFYASNNSSNIDLNEKLKSIEGNQIIILPNLAHNTAYFMSKISGFFSNGITTFIGGDGWGDWNDTEVGKLGIDNSYEAYHIVPWSLDVALPGINGFYEEYKKHFGNTPENKLSFVIYRTIISATTAYKQNQDKFKGDHRNKLIQSYKYSLANDPYWFKPTQYVVYKIKNKRNCVYALVNPITHFVDVDGIHILTGKKCSNDD